MLELLKLGVPIESANPSECDFVGAGCSVLNDALLNQRETLVEPLIAKGILNTLGKPDQRKIDAAFDVAIADGRRAPIQAIWKIHGATPHPSLVFNDVSAGGHIYAKSPVTLRLWWQYSDKEHTDRWEGLKIAKWLVAKGCDPRAARADGKTLLHIAAEAGNTDFVRYLLDQGMNPSTPDKSGQPPLRVAGNEDVALVLLNAGSELPPVGDYMPPFPDDAEEKNWQSVVSWLKAHNKS